jgi:protein SCO1/2
MILTKPKVTGIGNLNHLPLSVAMSLAVVLFVFHVASAQIIRDDDPALRGIDVVEHPGDTIPLDVILTDDQGREVLLGDYFKDNKPVALVLAYYRCPMLCDLVLNGMSTGLTELSWVPGNEYRILTVSFDPTETYKLASEKKSNYIESYWTPAAGDGWAFFVAAEDQSKKLADAVGFKYYYDEEKEMYAHAALVTILTGEGVISRYLYGIEFKPRDLRLALLEASEGKIGSTIDRILLFCYHYDPDAGGYTILAANVMKLGGVITLVLLGIFLGIFWLREIRRRPVKQATNHNSGV